MSNQFTNPIAEVDSPDSGWIVTPDVATRLKERGHKFYCPDFDCPDEDRVLFTKTSSNNNLFFSHRKGYGHNIRPETLLHKLAIKWFEGKTEFEIPAYSNQTKRAKQQIVQLEATETRLEYSQLKKHIPDVKLQTIDGFAFAIEIVVTNDMNANKIQIIKQFGLPTIRIELTSFYLQNPTECRMNKEFIESRLGTLLTDMTRKSWAVPPDINSLPLSIITELLPVNNHANNKGCIVVLPIVTITLPVAWLLLEFLFS